MPKQKLKPLLTLQKIIAKESNRFLIVCLLVKPAYRKEETLRISHLQQPMFKKTWKTGDTKENNKCRLQITSSLRFIFMYIKSNIEKKP